MTMSLPEPTFVDRDWDTIERECIAYLESPVTGLGRPLAPSGVERIFLSLIVYREVLLRNAIQEAALQNLPAYARFPMIDHLAAIAGIPARLAARPAVTVQEFTLPAALGIEAVAPAGTQIRSKDGKVTFALDSDVAIAPGDTHGAGPATCTTPGLVGNGYGPGQISELVAPLGFTVTTANLSTTRDGSPSESTPALLARMAVVPRASSVAGPEDAYRALALAAHPDVLEVAVLDGDDGAIEIVVLARSGAPSPTILAAVLAACDAKTVRPMSDRPTATAATPVDYAISVEVVVRKGISLARKDAALAAVETALQDYAKVRASGLGRSIILSALIGSTVHPDVYRVTVLSPVETAVPPTSWARCTSVSVAFAGYATGD